MLWLSPLTAVDRSGERAGLTLRPRDQGPVQLHRYVRIDGILLASAAEKGSGVAGTIPVLAEQRVGWRLMIFCARATRGLRRPSLDARSERSISPHPGREHERAWKDQLLISR